MRKMINLTENKPSLVTCFHNFPSISSNSLDFLKRCSTLPFAECNDYFTTSGQQHFGAFQNIKHKFSVSVDFHLATHVGEHEHNHGELEAGKTVILGKCFSINTMEYMTSNTLKIGYVLIFYRI